MKYKLALGLIAACGAATLQAQSMVQIYGNLDAAIRRTNNEGPPSDPDQSRTRMLGGGMSQSLIGFNITEELDSGLRVRANMEQRFDLTTGGLWRQGYMQSWLGLESTELGMLSAGRQYNALFELFTTTFPSYPYSPYMESFKPEMGFALGARANDMLKYNVNVGKFRLNLQKTWDGETDATLPPSIPGRWKGGGKVSGGFLRYGDQPGTGSAIGVGYLQRSLGSPGKKIKALAAGASHRTGPWYFNTAYLRNKHNLPPQDQCGTNIQCRVDYVNLQHLWASTNNGGFSGSAFLGADRRQMVTIGVGYDITPRLNLGAHYWYARQSGHDHTAKGHANFGSSIMRYAFSRRTDVYASLDYINLSGDNLSLNDQSGQQNGATTRNGMTLGFRHRF